MRILEKVFLLHFVLFTAPSTADIISLKLQSNNRHMILFSEFEFSHDGYVSFVISSVTAISTSSRPDPSRIGFVLQSLEVRKKHHFEFQQNPICPLDFKLNSVLFTFQDLSHDPQSSFNRSFPVTYPGMYSLFFVNCNVESLMTMDGRAELYNTNDGTTKNYLSAGLTQLPFLYSFSSFIYLCFLGFWVLVCFRNQRSFHRVHLLMSALLVMNLVRLICAVADLYFVKVTGTPHGLDVLFNIFKLIRTVLLFTVIVLIGTGCCFWKPSLEGKEKLVLMSVILLQVWANVYSILAWEAGPYNEDGRDWRDDSQGMDIICCFAIFVPMAWSIISLKENRETCSNAVMNGIKLFLFGLAVFVYVVFTRILVPIFIIPWVNYWVEEISLLVLCMVMFYIFRPSDEDDDGKALEMAALKLSISSCFAGR